MLYFYYYNPALKDETMKVWHIFVLTTLIGSVWSQDNTTLVPEVTPEVDIGIVI